MVLSDFGAALTVQSTDPAAGRPMTATMAYVAPEVITGEPLDGRADVYSLGCTLFRLLAGEHPFSTVDGIPATVRAHLETAPRDCPTGSRGLPRSSTTSSPRRWPKAPLIGTGLQGNSRPTRWPPPITRAHAPRERQRIAVPARRTVPFRGARRA